MQNAYQKNIFLDKQCISGIIKFGRIGYCFCLMLFILPETSLRILFNVLNRLVFVLFKTFASFIALK